MLHQFTFCLSKNAFGHTQQSHSHKDYNTVGHLPETQMEKKGAIYDDYIYSFATIQKNNEYVHFKTTFTCNKTKYEQFVPGF